MDLFHKTVDGPQKYIFSTNCFGGPQFIFNLFHKTIGGPQKCIFSTISFGGPQTCIFSTKPLVVHKSVYYAQNLWWSTKVYIMQKTFGGPQKCIFSTNPLEVHKNVELCILSAKIKNCGPCLKKRIVFTGRYNYIFVSVQCLMSHENVELCVFFANKTSMSPKKGTTAYLFIAKIK